MFANKRNPSIQEKLQAIQMVHDGNSKAFVSRRFGVPESTLRGWCKNEAKIYALANKWPVLLEPANRDGPPEAKRSRNESPGNYQGMQQQNMPAMKGLPGIQNNSWFWDWYKQQYGPQIQGLTDVKSYQLEPIPLVKSRPTFDDAFLTVNNNNKREVSKEKQVVDVTESSADNDLPTAEEALRHGEKFLQWLESCSHPRITTFQLLQFGRLLHNARTSVDQRHSKSESPQAVKRM